MAAVDSFATNQPGLSSPLVNAVAVTPNDSTDLDYVSRALYIGTAGALTVITSGGDTVAFGNVGVGLLPLRVSRVKSSGTTAANIVALR